MGARKKSPEGEPVGAVSSASPPTAGTAALVDMGPLTELVGYLLRRTQLAVFQDIIEAMRVNDIRPAQFSVLVLIHRNPGIRQSEISAALDIRRANLVALVEGLAARGLIRRQTLPHDRRAQGLYLTEDGNARIAGLLEIAQDHEARMAARLGEGDLANLRALLRAFLGDALVTPRVTSSEQ